MERPKKRLPAAIVGPPYAISAGIVSELGGGGMGMVHVNGAAISKALDASPLFARTAPTLEPLAEALVAYFKSLEEVDVKRIGVVFSLSAKGLVELSYMIDNHAAAAGIQCSLFGIHPESFDKTTSDLKDSGIKYVVALLGDAHIMGFMQSAVKNQITHSPDNTNDEHVWYFVGKPQFASPIFQFDRDTQADLAHAFHGIGMFNAEFPESTEFNLEYEKWTQSPEEQKRFLSFLSSDADRQLFQNYTFRPTALSNPLHMLTYDAVIALGIAACHTPGLFSGEELHRQLLRTFFTGVTGKIQFDRNTGTRSALNLKYGMTNIFLSDQRSTNTTLFYDTELVATVEGWETKNLSYFRYPNNSTLPPPNLPPVQDYNYNLIPLGVQVFAWSLSGLVILSSLGLIAWTVWNRKKFVVSSAQPIFLIQLCVGTIILAATIIPLGFQGEEESAGLDIACTSVLWFFCLGLVFTLSALLSKTWRIKQLLGGSMAMQRVKVEPLDVAVPFFALLIWNISLLTAWTILAPSAYVRVEGDSLDPFGRSTSSYGNCRPVNHWALVFGGLCMLGDFFAVVFVAYQCYQVRDMSTYFAETNALGWSALSLTETGIVFLPICIALADDPTTAYLVLSVMIAVLCLSFLVPIFSFRIYHRNAVYRDAKEDEERKKKETWEAIVGRESDDDSYASRRSSGMMSIVRHGEDVRSSTGSGIMSMLNPSAIMSVLKKKTTGEGANSDHFVGSSALTI